MTSYAGRFAGKIAVVTGAAQGIGRTVAARIAHEGGGVALVDRSPLVEEVRREAEATGAAAIAIIADLEAFSGATAAIDNALQRFGRIDILVNNVGGTIWAKPYAEYEEAQIEAEIRRSLFPTLWCCRAVLPGMLARRRGHRQRVFRRDARRQPRALRGGEGRCQRHHSISRHGMPNTRTCRGRCASTSSCLPAALSGRGGGACIMRAEGVDEEGGDLKGK